MSTSDRDLERAIAEDRFHKGLAKFGEFDGFTREPNAMSDERLAEWRRLKISAMSDEEIKTAQERLDRILGNER